MFGNIDIQLLLIRILVLTFSLSFHEYAHARTAYRLGDDTAALQGRLTMNPMRHLDPIGSLAFLFAGVGWARPVPVNPRNFRRDMSMKKGMMLTSLAGPVSNLLIAFVAQFLLQLTTFIFNITTTGGLTRTQMTIYSLLVSIFVAFYYSNIGLAIFNLLPVPPLDGSKVFGSLLPNEYYYKVMRYERYIGMIFLFFVIFFGNVIGKLLYYIAIPFNYILAKPWQLLFDGLTKLVLG